MSAKLGDTLTSREQARLTANIHEANIVTACQFCNSTTSRDRSPVTMEELIAGGPNNPRALYEAVMKHLRGILERKRSIVAWKLEAVRVAFEAEIRPELERRRAEEPDLLQPWGMAGVEAQDSASPS